MSDTILNQLSSIPNVLVEPRQGKDLPLVAPLTVEALSQVMKSAYSHQWRVIPSGSGSKLNWGGIVKDPDLLLTTQNLNKILDHAVSDLTVTVESGVKLVDLQRELAKFKQFLPIDPAYLDQATLGGIVATGDTGSYRQGYGGVRDLILGVSWIRSDGELAKAGGKVVKNVAGCDMMKILTGSYGTLGIITSMTFRLYPLPENSQTVLVTGEAAKINSLAQTIRMSSLTPTMTDLLSAELISRLGLGEGLGLILRWQTIPDSIAEQVTQVKDSAERLSCLSTTYEGETEVNLWQKIKQTIWEGCRVWGVGCGDTDIICKIGIKPSQATAFLTFLNGLPVLAQIHLGSGVGYLQLEREDLLPKLRSHLEAEKGFLTVLDASTACKTAFEPWGYTGNALEMMRKIKQQFDPLKLLSPGRFIGNI